jgi:carboxynorspermidine decarboxylase
MNDYWNIDNNRTLINDLSMLKTPSFVIDTEDLKRNLQRLESIKKRTGCKILLALKAFATYKVFPLLRQSLDGVCASSQDEARLGREAFNKEVHSYAAAFSDFEFDAIMRYSDHIVFNSFNQWKRFRPLINRSSQLISCGIRINPEHSECTIPLYDPCAKGSRLGVKIQDFEEHELTGLSGLHFHTLCEHNADALERTLAAFEKTFGKYLVDLDWLNLGGGHHMTKKGYDIDLLCHIIENLKRKYHVEIYLEPGEAIVLNAGYFVASVLDIINCDIPTAILDTSAATHMPDVLEVSYRPHIIGSAESECKQYKYRLGGMSCLADDIIGTYSFDNPLKTGDKLIFTDMAHYTMVKTNTFNGIRLPSIFLYDAATRNNILLKDFTYDDYKSRLS